MKFSHPGIKLSSHGIAIVESDSHLSKWIEEQNTLEVARGYCEFFKGYIPLNGIVVDIGACLGDMTATFSRMTWQSGFVYAYEPNPIAFECLAYNMRTYANVVVNNLALGDKESTGHMIGAVGADKNLGASQLVEGGDIRVSTLDNESKFWKRLDFIKIDAEGWEPKILRGGLDTIKRFKPTMLIEVNKPVLEAQGSSAEEVYSILAALNYKVKPSEPHLSLSLPQVDILCTPN